MIQKLRDFFILRRIVKLGIFAFLFFGLGFIYKYYVPRLEAWLLMKVKQQSQENAPVHIVPEKLSFHLMPLGATLENVKISPKKELASMMAPTEVGKVGATLNLLSLLRGQLRLSTVYLADSEISLFLNQDLFKAKDNSAKFDFETIYRLPVDQVILENVVIQGKLVPQNIVFRSESIDLSIENRYRSLLIELNIPKVMLKPSGPTRPISVQLQARTLLESKEAQISAFKLKADDSYVVASGRLAGDMANGEITESLFNARAHINLTDIAYWLETLPQMKAPPKLLGVVDLEASVDDQAKQKSPQVGFQISGDGVQIGKYVVGTVKAKGRGTMTNVQLESLTVTNNSGSASLTEATLEKSPNWKIKSSVSAEKIELGQMLRNLGVKAPIRADVGGNLQCQGQWSERPDLTCLGKAHVNRLLVTSGAPSNTKIVEAGGARAEGSVTVDLKEVKYKAALNLGDKSKGLSDGVINYDTGFKINFESELLDTKDVQNIANLKLEGTLNLKGHTEGTSDWGTVTINAQGADIWLEDYPLGNLITEANYKSGTLTFNKSQGQYGVSRYNGIVGLDLIKEQISIDGQMPFVDLRDVFAAFQRKTTFPFVVNGTGSGALVASGPFNFHKLSYKLQSSFFRGSAFEENFDKVIFNVSAENGNVKADNIQMSKGGGVVDMTGTITPEGVINSKITGRRLRLEQSENVMNLGLDLQGQADFTLGLKGQLPRPLWEMEGRVTHMILAEKPTDDSRFIFTAHNDHIEGSGTFMGSVVETMFNVPFDNRLPFLLRLKTNKLDFTNVFSLLSRSARQLDFSTSLSMEAELKAPTGGFWASSGAVKVSQFVLRKGPSSMQAEKPMHLTFNNGQISSKDFEITSGDSYLRFEARNMKRDSLDSSLNGKMDLSLLGLFTPFISDLRGNLSISMDLKGSAENPNMSGSAYIDKAYVKLRDFPHPFSSVRSDILFNQKQVLINALRADFAGGKASGEGRLEFLGPRNNPVDIRGIFSDVNLNFPEGFATKGSGQVAIRGSQFPYLMQIQYEVTGGEVTAEFQPSGGAAAVKASNYLPKFIANDSFQPFSYFVDVSLRKPVLTNNSLVQALVQGEVKTTGTPDRLLLNGTLTPLPGGKVFFHEQPFDIINGYVEFNNSSYDSPKIYLNATATVKETVNLDDSHQQENQYDVSLQVQGKGTNPQIILSSQPPLSQKEIISLLALGLTPEALDQSRKSNTGTSTGTAVGNVLLQRQGVSKKLKAATGIDVKLSSSQATQETASAPKVTISKQWSPKFGVSASSTLLDANRTNDVKLEYKMNRGTSVIGSWEGKEQGTTQKTKDTSKSVFGLDLEYKVNFK